MRFVAIDVETANARYHSICQIGVALFEDGREIAAERVFVDPREDFGHWNIRVHGIRPEHVAGSPCFPDLHQWLGGWIDGETVACHSHFDRSAIGLACDRYGLSVPGCEWIDSMHIAMRAWPDLTSYRLENLAARLGIVYRAHDALEDARACAEVIHRAIAGASLEILQAPASLRAGDGKSLRRFGDGDGGLLGETVVFTGKLMVPKEVAADMASAAGAAVIPRPTKKMTMLVVGERDLQPGWQSKSGKHRRTEELIEQGHFIRIVGEPDFLRLAALRD